MYKIPAFFISYTQRVDIKQQNLVKSFLPLQLLKSRGIQFWGT